MPEFACSPPADLIPGPQKTERCKICGGLSPMFDVVDFNKHCGSDGNVYNFGLAGIPIYLYRCEDCQFIFISAFDKWKGTEFSSFIYNDEYVKVDGDYIERRPQELAERFQRLFEGHTESSILDYGSGSGVMAAQMRQAGFRNVQTYDPFSSPSRPAGQFDFVLCTEVVEHSVDPCGTFADMRSFVSDEGAILFTTALQPPDISTIRGSWWYMGPRNGHISFYNATTLSALAEKIGFQYYPGSLHCFKSGNAGDVTRWVTRTMDRPLICLKLCAPPGASPGAGWHGVERSKFRWSANNRLRWPLPLLRQKTLIQLELSFVNEVQGGFVGASRFRIGPREWAGVVERRNSYSTLIATVEAEEDAVLVELVTPPTVKPSDLRPSSSDQRELGVAVLVA